MSLIKVYGAFFAVLIVAVVVVGLHKEGSEDERSKQRSRIEEAREQERALALHRAQQTERLALMRGDGGWTQRLRSATQIGEYGGPRVTAWDLQNVLTSTQQSYVFVGKVANLQRLPDESDRLTLEVLFNDVSDSRDRCGQASAYGPAVFLSVDLDTAEARRQIESSAALLAGPDRADCLAVSARVTSIRAVEGTRATLVSGQLVQLAVIPKL